MKSKFKHKQYAPAFKSEVLKLTAKTSVALVAKELNVYESQIYH